MADGSPVADRAASGEYDLTRYHKRFEALQRERITRDKECSEIARLCAPKRGRLDHLDRNQTGRKHSHIYNEEGIFARRTLAAGLLNGLTSASRPWFELEFDDPDLTKWQPSKIWLATVRDRMNTVFRVSNTYSALASVYAELAPFATACAILDDSYERVIHTNVLTYGRYLLATDHENMPQTMMREISMSVEQIVEKFIAKGGRELRDAHWEGVDQTIRNLWDKGDYDSPITVRHAIEPRREWDAHALGPSRFPVASIYWLKGSNDTRAEKRPLGVSGYQVNPIIAPRWEVIDNDTYGIGCGDDALGSIKQLQHMEKVNGAALERNANPHLLMPVSMRGRNNAFIGGGVSYIEPNEEAAARPLYQSNTDLRGMSIERQDIKQRINRAFYADTIMAISSLRQQRGGNITATEIAEIAGERMAELSPVIERFQVEAIEPIIERTFARMQRTGLIPPPPPELAGHPIRINHVSEMALARKAYAAGKIRQSVEFSAMLAQMDPSAFDTVDVDRTVAAHNTAIGAPPEISRDERQVAEIRKQRAQQQMQMQMQEELAGGVDAAQKLGSVQTQGGESNAAVDLVSAAMGGQ